MLKQLRDLQDECANIAKLIDPIIRRKIIGEDISKQYDINVLAKNANIMSQLINSIQKNITPRITPTEQIIAALRSVQINKTKVQPPKKENVVNKPIQIEKEQENQRVEKPQDISSLPPLVQEFIKIWPIYARTHMKAYRGATIIFKSCNVSQTGCGMSFIIRRAGQPDSYASSIQSFAEMQTFIYIMKREMENDKETNSSTKSRLPNNVHNRGELDQWYFAEDEKIMHEFDMKSHKLAESLVKELDKHKRCPKCGAGFLYHERPKNASEQYYVFDGLRNFCGKCGFSLDCRSLKPPGSNLTYQAYNDKENREYEEKRKKLKQRYKEFQKHFE
jgi:ribosomal protein S27AE